MTNRIRIFSHNNGNAVNVLKGALAEAVGAAVLRIKPTGSRFTPRQGDLILNYGSSQCPFRTENGVKVLNNGDAIAAATNKATFFSQLQNNNNVPLPDFTATRSEAQAWVDNGDTVYARTVLQGHSGEGIVVCDSNNPQVPQARLYTKGITGGRREYRIHVFRGEVILVQKKQRRNGYQENPNYSETVRNLDGGWVFGISSANPSDAVRLAAVNTVNALGLDFGAVDIIAKGQQGRESEVFVLEVNTAPGQGGESTTNAYVQAIMAVYNNEAPFSPYGISGDSLAGRANDSRTHDASVSNNHTTAEVSNNVSNARSGSQGVEVPPEQNNRTAAPQAATASAPSPTSGSQLNQLRLVDVINGDRNQLALEAEGGFYIFGEEVPVEVRNVRRVTATVA